MKFFNQDVDTNSILTSLTQCLTNYKESLAPFIANQINGPISSGNIFRMIGVLRYQQVAGISDLLTSFPAGSNADFDAWLAPKILAANGRLGFIGNIGLKPVDTIDWDTKNVAMIWKRFDGVTNWRVCNNNYDTAPLFNAIESAAPLDANVTFAGSFIWFGPPS